MMPRVLRWTPSDLTGPWRFAELSTGATRFEVGGPPGGPPVLLVHGLTYPLEVWTFLHHHLAASGHRVVRYDLPGRGLSAFDGQALTLAALAAHALEVLEVAEVRGPCALVSMSNADLVLAQLATQAPERVASLVCVAPSGLDPRTVNTATRLLRLFPPLQRWSEAALRRRTGRRIEGHRAQLEEGASAEARAVYDVALRTVRESPAFGPAVLSQLAHAGGAAALEATVSACARMDRPVTFVDFRGDRDSQAMGVQVFRDQLPRARWVTLDGDHMGLVQRPAPVNAAVERAVSDAL